MNHYAPAPFDTAVGTIRSDITGVTDLPVRGADRHAPVDGKLARALGWFSVGLGLTEILAPRALGRAIGLQPQHTSLLPVLGMREVVSGLGILAQGGSTNTWVKSRVAGDALDLGLLGAAFSARGTDRTRLAVATAAVVGVTALDVLCSVQGSGQQSTPRQISRSVAIARPAEELYDFWRRLENLPKVMTHLQRVEQLDLRRSRWTSRPLFGRSYEWTAEITEDMPNQRIAWRSLEGADVPNRGVVTFRDQGEGRGTVVTVILDYAPPAGKPGVLLTKLIGESPEQQILADLRRWKSLTETGEVATTAGQTHGRRTLLSKALP